MRVLLTLLIVVSATLSAPVPFPKPKKDVLSQMQGLWRVIEDRNFGAPPDVGYASNLHLRVEKDRMTYLFLTPDGKATPADGWNIVLGGKPPATTIDWCPKAGQPPGVVGVLNIDKDRMEMNFHVSGDVKNRPAAVTLTKPGQRRIVFMRVTKP